MMNERMIYTTKSGGEIWATNSTEFEVMLDSIRFEQKPTKPESKCISRRLESTRKSITIGELAEKVGENGVAMVPALLDGQGRKSQNWVKQQLFVLDFDEDITLDEFDQRCEEIGVQPALVYLTFRHSEKLVKFRAVFVLDHVVSDGRMRNLMQQVLMKLFPECDEQCKDPTRIYFGGKSVYRMDETNRINPFQIFETCMGEMKSKCPSQFARNRKKFLNEIGVDCSRSEFGVESYDQIEPNYVDILYPSYIYKEQYKNSPFSLIVFENKIFSIHWKEISKNSSSHSPRHQSQARISPLQQYVPNSNTNLTPDDLDTLKTNCQLFREFQDGDRRLGKLERRIVLSNIFGYRNGLTVYRDGLSHFQAGYDVEDPYPEKDADLIYSAKKYNWKPERCASCPYSDSCTHGTNLIEHVRLRRNSCRKVEEPQSAVSLKEARVEVRNALETILVDERAIKNLSILRADCGVGKTQVLLKLLSQLDNICLAFPTHRLAQEAYERYKSLGSGVSYFLWPDRPRLPKQLQEELAVADKLGVTATKEIYERATECEEVIADSTWASQIESYLSAYTDVHKQSRVFCTHEKAVRLIQSKNGLLHTFVFDEDPMKSLFNIDAIKLADVESVIKRLIWSDTPSKPTVNALQNVVDADKDSLVIPDNIPYAGIDMSQVVKESGVTTPVHHLLDCTGYIKPEFGPTEEPTDVYCITERPLPDRNKYVILSATPILPLYEKAYGDRLQFIDTQPVELKGQLYLHRERSYSKSCIQALGKDFVPRVEELVQEFGLDGIITHKEFTSESDSERVVKGSESKIPVFSTFGATEGFNNASGKNLGVIGTPHLPEYALKLLGHAVGVNMNGVSFEFAPRTVRRHEFEVSLGCLSEDEFVQASEFSLVERELVQAVGRARLLDNDVVVRLFSNYVVGRGELWRDVG